MTDSDSQDEASGSKSIVRLPLAKMGPGDSFVRRQVAKFRTDMEQALGTVNVAQASRVHTAAVAMRRYLQAERRLAKDGATLSVTDWTALADRTVRYKEVVDRSLAALGLDCKQQPADPWDCVYNPAPALLAPPAAATAPAEPVAEAAPHRPYHGDHR